MTTRNPSAIRHRARAHRAMALAALHANTSRRHRQARYDNHTHHAARLEHEARQYLVEVLDASGAVLALHGPYPASTPIHDLEQRPELTGRKVRVQEVRHA
ncbi:MULTISPECIES: hypothetical protein [unclassified Pseudomonas]|uniref:hypothetical protein n=1 Tax=unclassified Pseudomonas TaxID=196821 RepID=UPI00244C3196|nr:MULTISPECIES: hypothetical protein [unclassified Pseudomonas]MDG9926545.1 hypothetical protein [Pseudomonas sp. GD04042]MDH0481371.1 hypothetical protein [Pseudomonas sp. GD04015]MDH0603320.1 hypothetical protein [Pseudomonas sp. GD03869]